MRVIFPKNLVFISKPRCGSTSLRDVLTIFIKKNYPDSDSSKLIINFAEKGNEFHPHITGNYLRTLLKSKFKEDGWEYCKYLITDPRSDAYIEAHKKNLEKSDI